MRFGFAGDRQHLFGYRHFQIHTGIEGLTQHAHIAIGDMTAILAQVNRNAIRAGLLGDKCSLNRIGASRTACITQRSDMVDIDA